MIKPLKLEKVSPNVPGYVPLPNMPHQPSETFRGRIPEKQISKIVYIP